MHDKKYDEEQLTELQEALKAHPAEERDAIYEEMVADGEFNPFAEDDNPHALIMQLKDDEAEQPFNLRLFSYLLAFLPLLLLPFSNLLMSMVQFGESFNTFGFVTLLTSLLMFLLVFAGRKLRSIPLQAHWLGIIPSSLFGLVLSGMTGTMFERMIGGVMIVVALGLLGRLISRNRHDNLITAFATLPLVGMVAGFISNLFLMNYISIEQFVANIPLSSGISGIGMIISLGLFFLGRKRSTRWAGLLISILTTIVSQLLLVRLNISLLFMFTPLWLVSIAVIAFFFRRDSHPKEKQPDDLPIVEPIIQT